MLSDGNHQTSGGGPSILYHEYIIPRDLLNNQGGNEK
nr:MAG TPA: hypothetical protein [Caudoviricetes sp.]